MNMFLEKYKGKSNRELEQIAGDDERYRLEARYAAVKLLYNRGESTDNYQSIIGLN